MAWTAQDFAENGRVIARVRQTAIKIALQVQAEAPTTDYHAERGAFAMKVLADPDTWAPLIAAAVAQNPAIVAATPDAADGDYEFVVSGIWNAFSVITEPTP